MNNLPTIAKTWRLRQGLNQKTMAKLVNCSQAAYCQFEAGKQDPKSRILLSILTTIMPEFKDRLSFYEADAELYLTQRGPRGRLKL